MGISSAQSSHSPPVLTKILATSATVRCFGMIRLCIPYIKTFQQTFDNLLVPRGGRGANPREITKGGGSHRGGGGFNYKGNPHSTYIPYRLS